METSYLNTIEDADVRHTPAILDGSAGHSCSIVIFLLSSFLLTSTKTLFWNLLKLFRINME